MRIAHFSDLHVLSLEGVGPARFLNKRFSGWVNLRLKRGHTHHASYVRAIAQEVARAKVDHVAITGDLTNLALEPEFAAARSILEEELHLSPKDVSIVPGNHDFYTRGALRKRRFTEFFAQYTQGDIDVAVDIKAGHFPYVKLRGPCAIIGLSSAVPRAPFVAAGVIGAPQLDALSRALDHPEVKRRTPVLLVHHPPYLPPSALKAAMEGLRDGRELVARLAGVRRGLLLHGHLHRRIRRVHRTDAGEILIVGATSASLHHEAATRMSGFNLYEIDDATGEIVRVEAHVLTPETGAFSLEDVPTGAWT